MEECNFESIEKMKSNYMGFSRTFSFQLFYFVCQFFVIDKRLAEESK